MVYGNVKINDGKQEEEYLDNSPSRVINKDKLYPSMSPYE